MAFEGAQMVPVYDMNKSDNAGMMGGGAGWMWVIMLFFLLAWGGFGGGGFGGAIQMGMCQGFNQTNAAIAESRFVAQQCCCETNRNIDAVRAENYKNTCEITTAIHAEAEATRALMTANVMQELRDQLQAAQLQLGNLSQTQNIINAVRPFPQPAYITCSPYTSVNGFGCGNGCGIV